MSVEGLRICRRFWLKVRCSRHLPSSGFAGPRFLWSVASLKVFRCRTTKDGFRDSLASRILAEIELAPLDARGPSHTVRAVRIPHCRDWQAAGSNARGLAHG